MPGTIMIAATNLGEFLLKGIFGLVDIIWWCVAVQVDVLQELNVTWL